jgi:hypothetical protein
MKPSRPFAAARSYVLPLCMSVLVSACATKPATRAEPPPPARVSDSAPDKRAALRSVGNLQLEQEDERWGIEAAKERKDAEKQKSSSAAAPPAQSVGFPSPAGVPDGGAR